MNAKCIQLLATLILFFTTSHAQAVITCTGPVSSGFSTAYTPTGVVPNTTQGTVTFSCTRSAVGDPTSVILASSSGLNPTGTIARAQLGANFIQYDGYKDSACSSLWTNPTIANSIPVTLLPVTISQPVTVSFWGCITLSGQVVPAGTYTDSVQMGVFSTIGAPLSPQPFFSVSILNPAVCSITSIQNIAFGTYVAFQITALVSPVANAVVNCTSKLPYTMALDTTSGVVIGLNYSLATSWTAGSQLRGTGPGQTYTITGTMPSGQAGTCSTSSCSGSDTRTLTITY